MALETLKGIEQIGEFKVVDMGELRGKHPEKFNERGQMDYKWFEKEIRPNSFIYVRQDKNSITFTLQKGPIKEVGVNGCQVDTMISAVELIIVGLQEDFPCEENKLVLEHLRKALAALEARRANRVKRGVEGLNKI